VGTKYDLCVADESSREVTTEEATEFASSVHAAYIETSSKSHHNVEKALSIMVEFSLSANIAYSKQNEETKNTILLHSLPHDQVWSCCH
jgi:hypothetical protein